MTDPDKLRADDQARLTAICQRCPALQTLANHVRDFAAMMRNLTGGDLPQWMTKVLADDLPGLHSFVKGVQRDLAAVTAGHTLHRNSGAVEGQVNRVKCSKGKCTAELTSTSFAAGSSNPTDITVRYQSTLREPEPDQVSREHELLGAGVGAQSDRRAGQPHHLMLVIVETHPVPRA
jgi:hypothetical protein